MRGRARRKRRKNLNNALRLKVIGDTSFFFSCDIFVLTISFLPIFRSLFSIFDAWQMDELIYCMAWEQRNSGSFWLGRWFDAFLSRSLRATQMKWIKNYGDCVVQPTLSEFFDCCSIICSFQWRAKKCDFHRDEKWLRLVCASERASVRFNAWK